MQHCMSTPMTEQWVQEQWNIYLEKIVELPESCHSGRLRISTTASANPTTVTAFADVVGVANPHHPFSDHLVVGAVDEDEPTTKTMPTSRQHHLLLNSYNHHDCCYVSSETTTTTTNATLPESEDSVGLTEEERFFGGWPSENDVDNQDSE